MRTRGHIRRIVPVFWHPRQRYKFKGVSKETEVNDHPTVHDAHDAVGTIAQNPRPEHTARTHGTSRSGEQVFVVGAGVAVRIK